MYNRAVRNIVIGAVILVAIGTGIFLLKPDTAKAPDEMTVPQTESSEPQEANITATFTIITDGITRSFVNSKYHNLSEDVFVTAENPSQVHVMKTGIKWSDFFATLPMQLTKECLITGDGETLCNGVQGTLRFYLNDVEDIDLLDKEINQGDKALIQFISF